MPVSVVSWLPRPLRPLARRLTLMVVLIVGAMMGAVLWLGFRRINSLAVEVAVAHVETSADQMRSSLQSQVRRLRRDAAHLATSPALGAAVGAFASDVNRQSALKLLAAERGRSPQVSALSLWSQDGKLLLVDGDRETAESTRPRFPEVTRRGPDTLQVMVSALKTRRDSVFYGIAAKISGADGYPIGYVVETRFLMNNVEFAVLLRGLVGDSARILVGNAGDTLWTDLVHVVHDGVGARSDSGTGEHASADGTRYVHALVPVSDTPWRVMVEVPRYLATSTARRFALDMALAMALLVIIGGLILWLTIRRSLRPLEVVTSAVTRLASGEPSNPVPVVHDDELGRLADAFNSMAAQVHSSAGELSTRARALEQFNEELQESESRYRHLVDHLPDGLIVHRHGVVVFANGVCARLLGAHSAADLIGRSIIELMGTENEAIIAQQVTAVQQNGATVPRRQLELRRVDKKPVVVEAASMPLTINGMPAVQTIMNDVSDRQVLEEQFRQAQKMEAVGRLAGGVAHDFNNLLTVIDAHAEFALRADQPEEARTEDIEEILRTSASAARLTRQLLAFSRKQPIAPSTVDLGEAINGLLAMLNRLIGDDVLISTSLAADLWTVRADPSHIEQALLNLALNARDAMPSGGALTFQTSNTTVGANYRTAAGEAIPAGDYVVLTVEDTGSGIAPEIQSKLFEPFFTTKQPGRGTGLGLSTVYGIVKQSGGYIWVYSEVERGTSFRILLPRYTGAEVAPLPSRTSDRHAVALSAHVLLVEDQPNVRAAISRSLLDAGFTVTEASGADEARQLLAAAEYVDIIVTDMVMPGDSGADFARDAAVVDRRIPVLIMSGYSEDFTTHGWQLPQNSSFISKPVSPRELIKRITEIIGAASPSLS